MTLPDTQTRRLAAVMATDMVGFSRLMQLDETGTLERQKAILSQLIHPKVAEFAGRVVKTTGDGALIEFASAVNAVQCAVAIQREMAVREDDIAKERRIDYRVGINLGDIISDGDDIFGDGVNVASRLEGLAEPGGVCISEAVFNSIKGKLDLGFAYLGPQKVKNLAEPIPTYRILLDPDDAGKFIKPGLGISRRARIGAAGLAGLVLVAGLGYFYQDNFISEDEKLDGLLVLPFTAKGVEGASFANAATENLIATLGRVNNIRTASHTFSMQYEGITLDAGNLPAASDLRYILDGSAAVKEGRVTFAARLRDIDEDSAVIWERRESGDPAAFLDLLARLKGELAGTLKLTLSPGERAQLQARPTQNVEAYLAFAEAERFRFSGNFFELAKTLPLYEKAMALDPTFIEAQVGYADVNFTIWHRSYNTIRYTLDALAQAEATIARILQADNDNPYALGIQIRIKIERAQWDHAVAEARGAVFLQPDEPWLRNILGQALLAAGKYDAAKEEFTTYEQLSTRMNSWEKRELAFHYLLLGEAKKALALMDNIPEEETDRIDQYLNLANAYAQIGSIEAAKIQMAKFLKETVWNNRLWQKGYFGRYSDPAVFEAWADALESAGLPASPFDFEAGRSADKLSHDDLVELFSDKFEEIHTVGPFGMPYSEERRPDGSMVMAFGWMDGQSIAVQWEIKDDQFCHRSIAVHAGREECNNVYIDREKSTEDVKFISNVYSFGILESEFRRIKQ